MKEQIGHPNWIYELKHDGFRGILYVDREQLGWKKFRQFDPLLMQVLRSLKGRRAILDGEMRNLTLPATANSIHVMGDSETSEIVKLQELLLGRFEELGIGAKATNNLARQLAHIAVLGRTFGENTLPLFLSLQTEHAHALFELVNAMKRDLDELRDAIEDLEPDFPALIKAFIE